MFDEKSCTGGPGKGDGGVKKSCWIKNEKSQAIRFNFKRRKFFTSLLPQYFYRFFIVTTSDHQHLTCSYMLLIVFSFLLSNYNSFCNCDSSHLGNSYNLTFISDNEFSSRINNVNDKSSHIINNTRGHLSEPFTDQYHKKRIFTDQFVLQFDGEPENAKRIAEKHGFIYLGHIFDNHHHVVHKRIVRRSLQPCNSLPSDITQEPFVNSIKQLHLKRRSKRDLLKIGPMVPRSRSRIYKFDDPNWPKMWYLNRGQGLDMNVQKVWEMNVTGRGVVVTILDDGLEGDHPDLVENYDPKASYDVNNGDGDPTPRYDIIDSNRHGTRCAGEVAASANNTNCAVGVAYHAKVGGVRMLDGEVTDAVEARSLSLNPNHIDIYSASWGPDDDGKTVDGPGELATKAFVDGVTRGRGGLGSIFIWASGNGGREHDNCNCDGYTNSIWTLSISSATENGLVPWYSEACSSTLATTYSSGSFGERQIVTTDLHHSCTTTHTGTSASAPLAAGIAALALEANPRLTWRDMQHIVVLTARPANLQAKDWKINAVGKKVSHSFGYGLMDAEAMVKVAKEWVSVPDQKICEVRSPPNDKMIPAKSHIVMSLEVNCDQVRYLEHVQAKVTLTATRRGDIHIYLTSPSGTKATLLAQRPMDNSRGGFQQWPFMSVHTWAENPNGIWKLEIHNEARFVQYNDNLPNLLARAYLKEWSLTLYGTNEPGDRRKTKSELSTPLSVEPIVGNDVEEERSRRKPFDASIAFSSSASKELPLINKLAKDPIIAPIGDNNLSDDDSSFKPHRDNHLSQGIHGIREDKTGDLSGNRIIGSAMNRGCNIFDTSSQCLECYSHLVLLDGRCLESCPDGYFTQLYLKEITKSHHYRCSKCHYSCKSCTGPNDNECNQCYPDAQLNWKGHCHPKELVQEINALERWYTSITVVFLVLCFLVVSLVVYIVAPKHSKVSCFHGFTESNHEPKYENVPLRLNTRRNNLSKQSTSIEMGTENATGMSNNILKEENSEDDA